MTFKQDNLSLSRRRFFATGLTSAAWAMTTGPSRLLASPAASTTLRAASTTAQLLRAGEPGTEVWAYNDSVPGEVLRLKQGEELRLMLQNDLEQPTSVHWHGLRVPNTMDGVTGLTQAAIAPGDSLEYRFRAEDAGTYWYHSHNRSWEQMAMGLYGPLIVEEKQPLEVDQDILLTLDDWRINNDGQIDRASFGNMHDWSHGGRQGNVATVNGKENPDFPVRRGERLRLRLINAANARIFQMDFAELSPWIIALDGQPVLPRQPRDRDLILAPGQRLDLLVDIPVDQASAIPVSFRTRQGHLELARLLVREEAPLRARASDAPKQLAKNPIPEELNLMDPVRAELIMEGGAMGGLRQAQLNGKTLSLRELAMQGYIWAFNGQVDMPAAPLLSLKSGQTGLIQVFNNNNWPHAMHLHGQHFRLVERDGKPMQQQDWRDTDLIFPGEKASYAFIAGSPGKWLFHCHMLEHQAGGMKTWIEVRG